jgi:hypothetical protein
VVQFQVTIRLPDPETTAPEPRLNWKKTDWAKFATTIKSRSSEKRPHWERLQLDPTPTNLNTWVTLLYDIIMEAATLFTPP